MNPTAKFLCFKVAICLLSVSGLARAELGDALAAYDKKEYAVALQEFESLAKHGNTKAQHNLGVMYERGEGVAVDYKVAAKWYRMAADKGVAASQYSLGILYETAGLPQGIPAVAKNAIAAAGVAFTQDYAEALRWYRLAAEQGHGAARNNLGTMYATGRGVPRNDAEAVKWFRLAASSKDFMGAFNLALCFQKGQGVAKNPVAALSVFSLLASGRSDSRASPYRDALLKSLASEDVETAKALTEEFRRSQDLLVSLDRFLVSKQ